MKLNGSLMGSRICIFVLFAEPLLRGTVSATMMKSIHQQKRLALSAKETTDSVPYEKGVSVAKPLSEKMK